MGYKDNFSELAQEVPTQKKNRLERLEQRISKLQKQKKDIELRENEKKRKEPTRRLIQIMAIAIKYLNCENDIEPSEFEEKVKSIIDGKLKKIYLENLLKIQYNRQENRQINSKKPLNVLPRKLIIQRELI